MTGKTTVSKETKLFHAIAIGKRREGYNFGTNMDKLNVLGNTS